MKEFVGYCSVCHEKVYCDHGFLLGEVKQGGSLFCRACSHEKKAEPPPQSD